MRTLSKLIKVLTMFFFTNIFLNLYDIASRIKASNDDDPQSNCNANIFSGGWYFMNAVFYLLGRTVSGLSAQMAILYLFFKYPTTKSTFD